MGIKSRNEGAKNQEGDQGGEWIAVSNKKKHNRNLKGKATIMGEHNHIPIQKNSRDMQSSTPFKAQKISGGLNVGGLSSGKGSASNKSQIG